MIIEKVISHERFVAPTVVLKSSSPQANQPQNHDFDFRIWLTFKLTVVYYTSSHVKILFRTPSSCLPTLVLCFKTSKQSEQHMSDLRHKRVHNLRRSIFRKTTFKYSTQIPRYRSHITSIPQRKRRRKKKISSVRKKTLQIKGPQTDLLNSVCSSVPQIDLMLCKRTDSEVELIANLHIHITNIAFRSLFNTPKS